MQKWKGLCMMLTLLLLCACSTNSQTEAEERQNMNILITECYTEETLKKSHPMKHFQN